MELFNSALGRNITFVRPAQFIIGGFIGLPHTEYYYAFLCMVYIVSVLGNTFVMVIIILDQSLRAPKYIAVLNLMFVDVLSNTALVPKVVDIFLFDRRHISYNDCLTFMFFCFVCLSMQSLNLVALAYDRMIAIIFPLHYQAKVTHRFMLSVIALLWLFATTVTLMSVGLLTRLSFCKSVVVINSYFCDHGPVYRLGCNDITPSRVIAHFGSNLFLWIPLVFILGSYCAIFLALFKISTAKERVKALKTCSGHLSLVAIYYLPIIFVFRFGRSIHPNARIINLCLSYVIPPTLNPIIYALQTQEIKDSLKKMLKTRGQSQTAATL